MAEPASKDQSRRVADDWRLTTGRLAVQAGALAVLAGAMWLFFDGEKQRNEQQFEVMKSLISTCGRSSTGVHPR